MWLFCAGSGFGGKAVIGVRAPITRVIAVMALLAAAVVALQGYVPGAGPVEPPGLPSPLAIVLMPVLLLVSIVVLLAGVIASQHRLPLSMPQLDPEREKRPKLNRMALLVPLALAAVTLVFAGGIAALFLLPGARTTPPGTTSTAPEGSGPVPSPDDAPAPDPTTGPTHLTGTALLIAAVLVIVLIVVAVAGLAVVAVAARREPEAPAPAVPEPTSSEMDSLTRAAEMGLAAVAAPGQDPRMAIIACYVAMERGLSSDRAAAPLASDTPMEVLARAFESGVLHDASARELVALFEEARFSPHSMLEWQRMRAEQLLRIVLADLQRRVVAAA